MNYKKYIEDHTLRCEASYRGGGIEIDLDDLLHTDGYKMTAYQNYLGGGMLGKVCNDCNFDTESLTDRKQKIVFEIAEELKRYFHNLTNHEDDEWESETYEHNQLTKAESAY